MAERRKPSDEELRRKLEAAAPLLEASRTRYRALIPALQAWGWRQRLREVSDIAREVARTDEEVGHALERASRRAEVEAWPAGEVRTLLQDTTKLRGELTEAVQRRLERDASAGEGLRALLGQVLGVPRQVAMGEREAAAQEALQLDEALLPALSRFGGALEAVFGRPFARGQRLPFTLPEYEVLLAALPEGERALEQGWAQVTRIDTTGGVERELRRRAKRAPKSSRGAGGPRALVHATFWRGAAEAHVGAILSERFAPVQLSEDERPAALRWLLARELDGAARLHAESARAALLMLAHELTASPEGRAPLQGGRAQVRAWAAQADGLEGDEDWRRLRDGLRALAARSFRSALPPLYRVGRPTERAALPERLTDFFSGDG
ncbi:MAG: hypothetical protein Q8L48_32140 [Archangium sp.]|nr:hypothetical protein [Archangium sp.]